MTTPAREANWVDESLPVDEARRLVARRTGAAGYPDEHAIAVARCAAEIAEALELTDEERREVLEGALLHDVGKLLIADEILEKPGPLTEDERATVNEHPVHGERIVGGAVRRGVAEVVRGHHERWDGSGYPDGLAGTRIPLPARIVAVADAFLAMLEHRPYRRSRSLQGALGELRRCAGSQFDPRCVDALTTAVDA